ncbi:MAG TPA: hypothetical protein EYH48_02865 [Aquifex aeolicus]|nr:hypothetical protein [Aquificales bacterium]HIQ26260.1 hypothetical protein [Aquifex aeolicus]
MGIKQIFKEDKDFFEKYKLKFKEELLKIFQELEVVDKLKQDLDSVVDVLFDSIFDFNNKKVTEKFRELIENLHTLNVPIKNLFSKLFLELLKEYINYLLEKEEYETGIKRIRKLTEVLDRYLELVDEIFMNYLEQMEKKVEEEEKINPQEVQKILQTIRESLKGNVELLAFYKVFPVLCKSKICSISDISLKVGKCPYKVFVSGEKVYIKIPNLTKDAIAEIINVDKEVMTIRPLKFIQIPPIKTVRVFPEKEIDVKIETPKGIIYGFLHYISFDEIGVIISTPKGIKLNEKVKVKFKLTTGEVETPAVVVKIDKLNNAYLLSLQLISNSKVEKIISRYVLKRQQEILKELKL